MADWQVEDHLIAFSYRIKPLKTAVSKLLDAGVHVFRSLWPDAETPRSPNALAEALMNAGMRLTEWRFSAGRAGADEALTYLLGWYETIDFDVVQTCRVASKFVSEDQWIKRRKELANFFTKRADLHTFIPNLPFMAAAPVEEGSEEEDGEDESEADAADDKNDETEAGGDDETASRAETSVSGSGKSADTAAPPA